jgi:hypothetical protein
LEGDWNQLSTELAADSRFISSFLLLRLDAAMAGSESTQWILLTILPELKATVRSLSLSFVFFYGFSLNTSHF